MFEISEGLDKRLKGLPFLEYLKEMEQRINNISYQSKSDSAYSAARDYARHIKYRFVNDFKLTWEEFDNKIGHNLKLSEGILDKYTMCKSDKSKKEVVEEFKEEYLYDLGNHIRARERRAAEGSTDPSVEDEEV